MTIAKNKTQSNNFPTIGASDLKKLVLNDPVVSHLAGQAVIMMSASWEGGENMISWGKVLSFPSCTSHQLISLCTKWQRKLKAD